MKNNDIVSYITTFGVTMEKITKKTPNRMVFEIDKEIHNKIKMHAIKRNITLKKWLLRAITEAILKEEQYE